MSKESNQSLTVESTLGRGGFLGRFDHALDPKKRFTIPRDWRTLMGNPEFVYVMPDPEERCLNIIPAVEMESRLAKLRERALFDPALSRVLRKIGASSEMPTVDVQGRIRISDRLMKFANLTGVVAMLGAVRTIQLWNPKALGPADEVDQAGLGEALSLAGF